MKNAGSLSGDRADVPAARAPRRPADGVVWAGAEYPSVTGFNRRKPAGRTAALPGLTPREREILAHIVAGRTYGEIARELVLSEKTVSVHVSHLLHKTGTTSRVELAQLARRVATSATD